MSKNAIEMIRKGRVWTDADAAIPEPTDAAPGSQRKIDVLAARIANGQSLWSPADRDGPLHSSIDEANWAEHDLEDEMAAKRVKLRKSILLGFEGRKLVTSGTGTILNQIMWYLVDELELRGCAVSLHIQEIDRWVPWETLSALLTPEDVQRLLLESSDVKEDRIATGDDRQTVHDS